jgi:hypothetical protein
MSKRGEMNVRLYMHSRTKIHIPPMLRSHMHEPNMPGVALP